MWESILVEIPVEFSPVEPDHLGFTYRYLERAKADVKYAGNPGKDKMAVLLQGTYLRCLQSSSRIL